MPTRPGCHMTMFRSYFPPEDIEVFHRESEQILKGRVSMGTWVEKFQAAAAKAHGTRHAFATNSCTAALEVSLLACGVEPGDEVIVPVQTFIASGMAVQNIDATPLFADIRPETLCLDPKQLERLAGDRVKAVLLVHFGGLISPDVDEIRNIAEHRGWKLIEDAAHAHGAKYAGKPAGSFGSAACFSYYPTKVLTAGEGGMIVTNDDEVAKIAHSYQYRGQNFHLKGEQFARPYGRNIRLPELNALLGVLQYGRLDEFTRKRRAVATVYDEVLSDEPTLAVTRVPSECRHNYWLYTVILPRGVDREVIKKRMKDDWDIDTDWSYSPPLHLMPVFRELYGCQPGDLPVAEDLLSRNICLPVHPLISEADARCIAECFLHVYRELAV